MELFWSRRAQTDLFDITDYYASISEDLGERIIAQIERTPMLLKDFPKIGEPTGIPGLRKLQVRGTAFILLYRVHRSQIEVARVIHSATDWRR